MRSTVVVVAAVVLATLTCASGGRGVSAPPSAIDREIDVPEAGGKTVLLDVKNVHFPAGQPAVIRIHAGDQSLGSFAIVPDSRDDKGERVYPSFLVNVTAGLRRLDAKRVTLRFVPYEGSRRLDAVTWSIEQVELTVR